MQHTGVCMNIRSARGAKAPCAPFGWIVALAGLLLLLLASSASAAQPSARIAGLATIGLPLREEGHEEVTVTFKVTSPGAQGWAGRRENFRSPSGMLATRAGNCAVGEAAGPQRRAISAFSGRAKRPNSPDVEHEFFTPGISSW